ncbi:MAG TPA: FG-GAP-like repeat-containing protein [Pyrinomonadaceae bacterium]|nr:FG-GAP-like repeat-containing protein [Pyrinomonadaceae bacterium]
MSFRVTAPVLTGTEPTALVAQDFNADGRLDLAVANNQSGNVSILLGDGADNFSFPINYTVGTNPYSISAGDFNGDGKTDLVTANYGSANISVLLGTSAGAFGGASNYATAQNPYGLAVGDFNGDGLSDIAVGSAGGSNTIAIFLSNGAGGFNSAPAPINASGRVYTITLGKFNGDNILDLALGLENQSAVFTGNGAGGFSAASPLPDNFAAKATGDFNGDAKADLVGTNNFDKGISVLLGDGAGNFSAPAIFPGVAVGGMTVGDFNGDGKSDVAALDGSASVFILNGDGTGQLGAPNGYGVGGAPTGIVSADFNADGKLDLAVASRQNAVTMLYGIEGGDFAGTLNFNVGSRPDEVVVADFNRDGKDDLAVVNTGSPVFGYPGAASVSILLGDGTGRMSSAPPIQFDGNLTNLHALITADFNNDGKADLAVAANGSLSDGVNVMLGNGDGSFSPPINTALRSYGSFPYRLHSVDVNRDGIADIVVSFLTAPGFATLLGTGTGNFNIASGYTLGAGSAYEDFTFGDFNQDANPDLVFPRYDDKLLVVLLGNGNGLFNTRLDIPLQGNPSAVVVDDFNRDGKADVAVAATSDSNDYYVTVKLGDGAGGFSIATDYEAGQHAQSIITGDFNGDDLIDLAVSNSLSDGVSVLTGDGAGGFGLSVPFVVSGSPRSLAAADFNRDGKTDLAVSLDSANSVAILLNNFSAPRPCLSVDDVTITEGDAGAGNAAFNVTLSAASAQTVKVNYRVEPRYVHSTQDMYTAYSTPGVDYQFVSGTLTFAAGTTTQTINVPVNGDLTDEYDEAFSLILSQPVNAEAHDPLGIGTILDNDAPPAINIDDRTVAEGNGTFPPNAAIFNVTLSAASEKPVSVQYQTADDTATSASDYQSASGTITFSPGTVTKTVSITSKGDSVYEPDETFFVNLSGAVNANVADAQGQGTVVNDDPLPTLSGVAVRVGEGHTGTTQINVAVLLSNPSYQTITVNYATADATATAGSDYIATSGSLTFNPGELSKLFKVSYIGDTIDEIDETFVFTLSDATNATTGALPSVTLLDDDGPNISVNDISVHEGDAGFTDATFTVTLSAISPQPVSVNYRTITDSTTATSGVDFVPALALLVQIPAGQLSATFKIQIIGDLRLEPDEIVYVLLSNPVNGTLADAVGACTILNDDAPEISTIQFEQAAYQFSEGAGRATLVIRRTGDKSGIATVQYQTVDDPAAVPCATANGHAYARCDYATTIDTVTFAPNEDRKEINVPLVDDAHVEGSETLRLKLGNVQGAAALGAQSTATLTINDNDAAGQSNPIFSTPFFVRQQYLDFLSREPEEGEPWSGVLNRCPDVNNNFTCDRILVSQSFFGSTEFRLKGFYVFNFYKVAFNRRPEYAEIIADMRSVTGQTASDTFARRAAFTSIFAERHEFKAAYNSLSNTEFVNALLDRYALQQITTHDPQNPEGGNKVTLTRADLIAHLSAIGVQALTRAQVLRAIVESNEVAAAEYNAAFVAMQYYGYLRRTPEQEGYEAWLKVINQDPQNVRIMVNGFMNSPEYRLRFGQQ